jgi:hypothetical protein
MGRGGGYSVDYQLVIKLLGDTWPGCKMMEILHPGKYLIIIRLAWGNVRIV